MRLNLWMTSVALSLALAAPAMADTINFGQFGAEHAAVSDPVSGVTAGGDHFTISGPPGVGFTVLKEGSSWAGEFVAGTPLLYDDGAPGAVTLTFATPLTSLTSLSIQDNLSGGYTAFVGVYSGATFINTFQYAGVNSLGPEGTIPSFNIPVSGFDKLVITTTNDSGGWALGGVVGPLKGGVPEPATWAMMLLGFGGLGATLRSRRRALSAA